MQRALCFLILAYLGLFAGTALAQQPTSQPTTAQTIVVVNNEENRSFLDEIIRTRLAEIVQGKRTLNWSTVRDPEFWYDIVKELAYTVVGFIPRLIGTIIFLIVFYLIYRGIRRVVMGNMAADEVDSSISNLLGAMIKWLVMGFGIVIACNQLGIPIVAMLTGVSLVGLAVGFAAQETLANFIAGIVIFLDKPFHIGDFIEIDGTFGQVKRVTFRATRVLSGDGDMHIFPNTHILSSHVVNHTTNPLNRVSVQVGIAYKESIDDARRVLLNLVKEDSRIVKEPAPEVVVSALADSSVNLSLRVWLADETLAGKIRGEYLEKAKNALDAARIEIPFPHMQVVLDNPTTIDKLTQSRGGAA